MVPMLLYGYLFGPALCFSALLIFIIGWRVPKARNPLWATAGALLLIFNLLLGISILVDLIIYHLIWW